MAVNRAGFAGGSKGQARRRVGRQRAGAGQPFEPGAQRREAAELAAEGERRSVRLAVGEQGALVAGQQRRRHLGRLGDAALGDAGVEEDIFNLAAAQPPALRRLSVDGCRVLARQFRERFEAHHARAAARVGHSLTCPFDLNALLPVPDAVLRLGTADVSAQAWLAANWGAERLRHVTRRKDARPGRRLPRGHAVIGYGFFTSGDTPKAAITTVAARWPGLRFVLQPRPD